MTVGRIPISIMCAPAVFARSSAVLRLARTDSSSSVITSPPSSRGCEVDLDVELAELGLEVGVGDRLERRGVDHRRVAGLVGEVELDLEPERAPLGVEAGLGEQAREDVEAGAHLLPVALAILAAENPGRDFLAHGPIIPQPAAEGGGRCARRYMPGRPSPPSPPAAAAEPGDAAHLARGELLGGADRLVDRGEDHVLEQLGVLGVDRLGVDRDLEQAQVAAHLHLHHPAAGARLDGLVLELLLRLGHLGLHLLGLLHQRVEVETTRALGEPRHLDLLRFGLAGFRLGHVFLGVELGPHQLDQLVLAQPALDRRRGLVGARAARTRAAAARRRSSAPRRRAARAPPSPRPCAC